VTQVLAQMLAYCGSWFLRLFSHAQFSSFFHSQSGEPHTRTAGFPFFSLSLDQPGLVPVNYTLFSFLLIGISTAFPRSPWLLS